MENTMNIRGITANSRAFQSTGLLKSLARFVKAMFGTREQNPLGLNDAMAARMYL